MSKNDNDTLFYDESNFLCPAQGQDNFFKTFFVFVISLDACLCIVWGSLKGGFKMLF